MGNEHRNASDEIHVLACAACPRVSSAEARGWKAYRVDDPYEEHVPVLAFYCPDCTPDD